MCLEQFLNGLILLLSDLQQVSDCSTWQHPRKDFQHLIFIQFTFAAFICASIASASFTLPMER